MAAQICEYCKHKHEDCYCPPNSTCNKYEEKVVDDIVEKLYLKDCIYDGDDDMVFGIQAQIVKGSKLTIGEDLACVTVYNVDQHFNWFQKLMWKWCFGVKVEDYSEK